MPKLLEVKCVKKIFTKQICFTIILIANKIRHKSMRSQQFWLIIIQDSRAFYFASEHAYVM